MKLSKYYEFIKPQYVYLKLIPDTSIRNYNSTRIAKTICHMFKAINRRIHLENKKLIIEAPLKVSYIIDIYYNKVEFYFVVPKPYLTLVKEKISETWSKITIQEIETIKEFSQDALKYQLVLKKEDAFSLNVDKKTNEPLNNILNVIDIMKDSDRVSIITNFVPSSQLGWRKAYDDTISKYKSNLPIDKEKLNSNYILKTTLVCVLDLFDNILEVVGDIFGAKIKANDLSLLESAMSLINNKQKDLSAATKHKRDNMILNTQLAVISDSKDTIRASNNINAVCQSYKAIEEDNELIYKKVKSNNVIDFLAYKLSGIEENKLSIDECQNVLQLPGRDLLLQHKIIEKIDVLENPLPEELTSGVMCIGETTYKGNTHKGYLSKDKNYKYLTLCLIGPTRAGKTTLISNLSKDAIDNGECTILFDFCGNCELSNDVSSVFKKDKILNIDCSNFETLQGLGYNEVTPTKENTFEVYRCAKTKTSQLMTLVNTLNADDSDLKARMERVLEASAVVVFIQNGTIKDVFEILQDYKLRHKFIDNAPKDQNENLEEYINTLLEIDEWSKGTKDNPPEIIGTKVSYTQGILSRVQKLKQNAYMELMLKKSCENNINLVQEIQKSQLICIRMPEIMFSTEQEKDIYCTYWITKIWGALQKRKWDIPEDEKRTKVNVIFDELYQVPNCQEFLRSKLSQIAKFSCKPIISCHYLGQINNIRNELKAANSSYMLLQGCDKDNFKELKEELDPYMLEDLLNLKRYHSLNLIKYEQGWAKFITKLPKPIK